MVISVIRMKHINYKNIQCKLHEKYDILEFSLQENKVESAEDFIIKLTLFNELVGFKEPNYVLFNKQHMNLPISKFLHEFAHKQIINSLFKEFSVKEVFFLSCDKDHEMFKQIEKVDKISAFTNINDLYKYIEKNN